MTIWKPTLNTSDGRPLYLAIANAIAEGIRKGELRPGDRLPPQRELADLLGVTLGTISRAYLEGERRGHLSGEVGRGTFVRSAESLTGQFGTTDALHREQIDLRRNHAALPESEDGERLLSEVLTGLARHPRLDLLCGEENITEAMNHREAGAAWLRRCRLDVAPDRVLIANGSQHGLVAVLSALVSPGDLVATSAMTNPGLKAAAALLHVKLLGLPMDEAGLVPEEFERACRSGRIRALYCTPTLHNPTAVTMPEARRRQIAAIAATHGIAIIEDEEYGALLDDPLPPLASFAPNHTYYMASLSKALGFGLRVSYVAAPPGKEHTVLNSIRASIWMTPPLVAEVATRLIVEGPADRLLRLRREEAAARFSLAAEALRNWRWTGSSQGFHLWLHLPDRWRAELFVSEAAKRGVGLASSVEFCTERDVHLHAVRVALGAAPSRTLLQRGLTTIHQLLQEAPGLSLI